MPSRPIDLLPPLAEVARALASSGQPGAGFEALDRAWSKTIGHCGPVLNIPVVLDRRALGTINPLHEAGRYQDAHIAVGSVFAALTVPGLAMLQQRP
jgi:hypothetical protein